MWWFIGRISTLNLVEPALGQLGGTREFVGQLLIFPLLEVQERSLRSFKAEMAKKRVVRDVFEKRNEKWGLMLSI